MATFPCPNPPVLCDQQPNPATQYSSEVEDSPTYIGIAWNGQVPKLGKPFTVFPCESICDSQVSQADADLCAQRGAVTCGNPCSPVFENTAQTATGVCPDGSTYAYTVGPGQFSATSQLLADRMAFSYAATQLRAHPVCLGVLANSEACLGNFYSGEIVATGPDQPFTFRIVGGELPDGISLTSEGNAVSFTGTPTVLGSFNFTLEARGTFGTFSQRNYSIDVITITTDSPLPDGTTGQDYAVTLMIYNPESDTFVWAISDGALPDGLSLDGSSGQISGTPTTEGLSNFTVTVTGSRGACSKDFTMNVVSGSSVCTDGIASISGNTYAIDGYFDGLISNPNSPSGSPPWDGSFIYSMVDDPNNGGSSGWTNGGFVNNVSIEGRFVCSTTILFAGCIDDVPQWQIWIGDFLGAGPDGQLWYGEKAGGETPEGVYNRVDGVDPSPATLTIILGVDASTPAPGGFSCAS